jgi:hypothetical protein
MNPDLALIAANLARNGLQISIHGIHENMEITTKAPEEHSSRLLPNFHHLCGAKSSCICHSTALTAIAAAWCCIDVNHQK